LFGRKLKRDEVVRFVRDFGPESGPAPGPLIDMLRRQRAGMSMDGRGWPVRGPIRCTRCAARPETPHGTKKHLIRKYRWATLPPDGKPFGDCQREDELQR